MAGKLGLKLVVVPPKEQEELQHEKELNSGQDIKITFNLPPPSTSSIQHTAKMGHNIEELKAFVAQQIGIPYDSLVFTYKDKVMLNPLTLNDIPVSPSEVCVINVTEKK
eukprot:TRINITY_DN1526_c0_g1_i1.p1 TRINITY_DN1526_c0_g1~~TRINITY_DN1526_c0_g1_i1.p1  ORF type:complete len:109 (-),score=27.46 TRINITY_DN1526_c0_g1_i1:88-414(-)